MTKLIKTASFVLGLLLAGLPAGAGTWNRDIYAGYWAGQVITYASWSGTYSAPSGATVGWYGHAHGYGSFVRIIATAPGVNIYEYYSGDGYWGGHQSLTSAGVVDMVLEAGTWSEDTIGCGITIAW